MIKFLVDSASDCSPEQVDIFVPIVVTLEGHEYNSGIDLSNEEFYDWLVETKEFPKTSQPSPEIFLNHFIRAKEAGDTVIYFCLSSALSGTYQGAVLAREMVGYDDIFVIDTKAVSHMIGILVDVADQLRRQGKTAREIVTAVEELKPKLRLLAGVETLEYLRRGGRLRNASAFVGTLAQIKPILATTYQGTVEARDKCLGKARAAKKIVERMLENGIDTDYPIYTIYSSSAQACRKLEELLREEGICPTARRQVGPIIGAHNGPDAYGVIFVSK